MDYVLYYILDKLIWAITYTHADVFVKNDHPIVVVFGMSILMIYAAINNLPCASGNMLEEFMLRFWLDFWISISHTMQSTALVTGNHIRYDPFAEYRHYIFDFLMWLLFG
jgi:hypothetical protein